MRSTLATLVAVTAGLTASCGTASKGPDSTPVGPSVVVTTADVGLLVAPLGDAWLQMWGLVYSSDPTEPLCTRTATVARGTSVTTRVQVTREGRGYVAKSAGRGSVDFHFAQAGPSNVYGSPIEGTIAGVAYDELAMSEQLPTDLSIKMADAFGAYAAVEGIGPVGVPFLRGTFAGLFGFVDTDGGVTVCRRLHWTLQPVGGVLPAVPPFS